jgi:hypothetical protein
MNMFDNVNHILSSLEVVIPDNESEISEGMLTM